RVGARRRHAAERRDASERRRAHRSRQPRLSRAERRPPAPAATLSRPRPRKLSARLARRLRFLSGTPGGSARPDFLSQPFRGPPMKPGTRPSGDATCPDLVTRLVKFIPLLVVAIVVGVYLNALNAAFVFDDHYEILTREGVRHLWPISTEYLLVN